jgi:hypothetical protein
MLFVKFSLNLDVLGYNDMNIELEIEAFKINEQLGYAQFILFY